MKAERYLFLDGLRGWASVVVLLYHVFVNALPPAPGLDWLEVLLPFNGLTAVYVFFIISGFALSVRYLDTGDLTDWIRIAAGRYFRLAISILAACAIVHLALVTGLLDTTDVRLPPFRGWLTFDPTWWHLLRFALFDVFFSYDWRESYIGPLWTMGPELAGSAVTLIAALAFRYVPLRWLAFLAIAAVLFAVSRSLGFFLIGMAAADFQLRGMMIPRWLGAALFAIGCAPLLFAFPWWSAVSAILIFAGATSAIRGLLETPLSRGLGSISFPLYLMHGPVINIVGEPLMRSAGSLGTRLAVDALCGAVSVLAAVAFAKLVNDPAIVMSRGIGAISARALPG